VLLEFVNPEIEVLASQFKVFDKVGGLFEAEWVHLLLLTGVHVADLEEGVLLEQNQFVRFAVASQGGNALLDGVLVLDHVYQDLPPRNLERLLPDGSLLEYHADFQVFDTVF